MRLVGVVEKQNVKNKFRRLVIYPRFTACNPTLSSVGRNSLQVQGEGRRCIEKAMTTSSELEVFWCVNENDRSALWPYRVSFREML